MQTHISLCVCVRARFPFPCDAAFVY